MKKFKLNIILFNKLYLYLLSFILLVVFLTIILFIVFNYINFGSDNLKSILFFLFIIIFSIYFSNFAIKKSSTQIIYCFKKDFMQFESKEVKLNEIKFIKLQRVFFNNYPKLKIITKNNEIYKYRFDKTEGDFLDFERVMRKFIKDFEDNKN
jgi:hypothetical protein